MVSSNWVRSLAGAGSTIEAHEHETIVDGDSVSFDELEILVGSVFCGSELAVANLRVPNQERTDLSEINSRIRGRSASVNRGMDCLFYNS